MSSLDKLVEKFVYRPETITNIGEVRRLLQEFGYQEKKKPGSECIFHKQNATPINVPTIIRKKSEVILREKNHEDFGTGGVD